MGKGIALQFKQAYPEMAKAYERACATKEVQHGRMLIWDTHRLSGPRYIINFPTKRHWKGKSKYEDIAAGLTALIAEVKARGIRSIAIPPLGCGNGGLDWAKVRPMIEKAFAELPDVRVALYAPEGSPATTERIVRTERPHLTRARALFLLAMNRYAVLAYETTLLEIHKLAYFLQEAGEPLRLKVEKGTYGPYADNLNKVLEMLEGHQIHGYDGSRSPGKEILLDQDAAQEADRFLEGQPDAQVRLARVARLIEGFETPYGMEVLSSVHYVAVHDTVPATSPEQAIEKVHAWNERKRKLIRPEHVRVAWSRLVSEGWLAPAPE